MSDITEKHQKEIEQEKFQDLIMQSFNDFDIAFSIKNVKTREIVFDSGRYDILFGIPKNTPLDEITNYWLNNIVHPEDKREQEKTLISDEILTPRRTYRIIHPKKGVRWIEACREKITLNKEKFIVTFMSDITDKKVAE
jgi:PAS domain-containing protein